MAFDFLNDYKGMGIFELNYMILDVRFYMFDKNVIEILWQR